MTNVWIAQEKYFLALNFIEFYKINMFFAIQVEVGVSEFHFNVKERT